MFLLLVSHLTSLTGHTKYMLIQQSAQRATREQSDRSEMSWYQTGTFPFPGDTHGLPSSHSLCTWPDSAGRMGSLAGYLC